MSLFPQDIVERRTKQYRARSDSLRKSPEAEFAAGNVAIGIIELGYIAAFATGVVVDTIKANASTNLRPRP